MKNEWQQKEFMLSGFFMTWHIDREAMDTYAALLKEAGIDLLIPYTASPLDFPMHRLYEACEKADIQILTGIREVVTDEEGKPVAKGITYQPAQVDEDKIRREIAALREKYPHTLAGHYLWDEPGMKSFEILAELHRIVEDADPGAFGYSCLLPSYGSYVWPDIEVVFETEAAKDIWAFVQDKADPKDIKRYDAYVSRYCEIVRPKILAQDYYPFQQHGLDTSLKSSVLFKDMGYLRKKAMEYGMEYWHIFSGVEEWTWSTSVRMDVPRIRVQMNVGLAYGCSGLSYFPVQEPIVMLKTAEKAAKFEALKAQNTKTKNIGNLLFHGISQAVYHTAGFDKPEEIFADDLAESPYIDGVTCTVDAGLVLGVIRKYPDIYLVAVNKDHENTATGTIELKQSYAVAEFDAETACFSVAQPLYGIDYTLEAGDIAVYRLT
ncbi:MAG: hypothetical protein IJ518_01925 [Clostridia bacterium]|nr:hypothetical protein [Clostridia bacterium]